VDKLFTLAFRKHLGIPSGDNQILCWGTLGIALRNTDLVKRFEISEIKFCVILISIRAQPESQSDVKGLRQENQYLKSTSTENHLS